MSDDGPENIAEQLRPVDLDILQAVADGATTTREIGEVTGIESTTRRNYALEEKLEPRGLVDIFRSEGRIDATEDQPPMWKPKEVVVTGEGMAVLDAADHENEFADLSRYEVISLLQENQQRIEELEERFEAFRKQVRKQL